MSDVYQKLKSQYFDTLQKIENQNVGRNIKRKTTKNKYTRKRKIITFFLKKIR